MNAIHLRAGAAAGLLLAALCACAAPSADPAMSAEPLRSLPAGSRWQLQDADDATLAGAEAGLVTLHVEADRIHGNSGCNQYSAGYRFEQDRFVIEQVSATKRACIGPGMAVERAFLDALGKVRAVAREGDALLLQLEGGASLSFAPVPMASE